MRKIWTIARMTFRENVRKRIVLTALVLGLLFLAFFSVGFHLVYDSAINENDFPNEMMIRLVRAEASNALLQAGLYAVTFLSVAMGALLAADTVSGEINSGTIQTIASKPVRRSDVILGKWLGFAILLGLYALLMSGGTALSVWLQSGYLPRNFLVGLSLIYLEALLIMTLALFFSCFLPGLATGGVVFGLYGLAFIGGWVEQIGTAIENETAVQVGIIISLVIPSESLWRRAAFEMESAVASMTGFSPFGAGSTPSPLMVWYAAAYLGIILLAAVSTFKHRDL